MGKRKIVRIDEQKCNGCGECIPNCREAAIQIINNKARLISDIFCDGLGACLGHCPQGAITIEEREAEAFDENKAMENRSANAPGGCPGARVMEFKVKKGPGPKREIPVNESELANWPVQIMLVPPLAPYLDKAHLLIAADCVGFAYADFHQGLLKGRALLVGCPKLDDTRIYQEKFTQIFRQNDIKSVTHAHMEVPCCFALTGIIKEAISASGKDIPFQEAIISIKGERIK